MKIARSCQPGRQLLHRCVAELQHNDKGGELHRLVKIIFVVVILVNAARPFYGVGITLMSFKAPYSISRN